MYIENADLKNLLEYTQYDPWKGTVFENYVFAGNDIKGAFGEAYVNECMKQLGGTITPRTNAGHDSIINGFKTEIKFALSQRDTKKRIIKENAYTFNHISLAKDWDRIIFMGIHPDSEQTTFVWMSKQDVIDALEEQKRDDRRTYFSTQQGGEGGGNDDFMTCHAMFRRLLASKYVKKIEDFS